MFKKLFLMLALVSSAGLIASEKEENDAVFADEIEQPGKFKRFVNFLGQNKAATGVVAVVLTWLSHAGIRKATYANSFKKALLADVKFFTKDWKDGYKADWKVLTCPTDAKATEAKGKIAALLTAHATTSAETHRALDKTCNAQVTALNAEMKKTTGANVPASMKNLVDAITALPETNDGEKTDKANAKDDFAKLEKAMAVVAKNDAKHQAIADFNA